jgi:hypothetical protein
MKTVHGVNAYTGHSNKATTVLDFYYHQNENRAGLKLSQLSGAGPKIVPVPEDIQEMMDNDDAEAAANGESEADNGPVVGSLALEQQLYEAKSLAQESDNR